MAYLIFFIKDRNLISLLFISDKRANIEDKALNTQKLFLKKCEKDYHFLSVIIFIFHSN